MCTTISFFFFTLFHIDYGLDTYRFQEIEEGDELVDERTKKLNDIYQAPEMLNDPFAVPTAAGDIYAFAIILIEIATRNEPYGVSKIYQSHSF